MRIRTLLLTALLCCGLSALPISAFTAFVEGEQFAVTGDGWQKDKSNESWEVVTCQTKASRATALWGAAGAGDSTASTTLTVPAAGTYRLHARYFQSPWRGPFHLGAFQQGKEVAGKDFDLQEQAGVAAWEYAWDWFDAPLAAGPVTLTVSRYQQHNCTGYARYLDCVLLTNELTLQPDHVPYGPQLYLRVTLGDGYEKPVYVLIFAVHYRDPWYEHYALSKDGFETGLHLKRAQAYS